VNDVYEAIIPQSKSIVTKAIISKPQTNKSNKPNTPVQPTPITIDNFFISTKGVFTELIEMPEGFTIFFNSKESKYYSNEDKTQLIRISNHWGYGIKYCSWLLKGYKAEVAWKWKKSNGKHDRIGIISISNLKVNPAFYDKNKNKHVIKPINNYWQP
jgi:hypothetical protein